MKLASSILILLVAILHSGFMLLEMVLWDHDIGRQVFQLTPEFSRDSAALAMNQGLYNGFLVTGLIWGIIAGRYDVKLFFLVCVIVAGVFGAATVSPTIFIVQALPAIIALAVLWFSHKQST